MPCTKAVEPVDDHLPFFVNTDKDTCFVLERNLHIGHMQFRERSLECRECLHVVLDRLPHDVPNHDPLTIERFQKGGSVRLDLYSYHRVARGRHE